MWLAPEHNEPGAILFSYTDLFREVADALRSVGQYEDALRFYEPLQQILDNSDSTLCGDMALCYRKLGSLKEAERWYNAMLLNDESNVPVRIELSRMFEDAGLSERSLPYLNDISLITSHGIQSESTKPPKQDKTVDDTSPDTPALLAPSNRKGPKKSSSSKNFETIDKEEATLVLYIQMRALKRESYNGDHTSRRLEWMTIAETLTNRFRKKKAFYPADKHTRLVLPSKDVRRKRARLQSALGNDPKDGDMDNQPAPSSMLYFNVL